MLNTDPSTNDVSSRDLLDLIVLGSIDHATTRIETMPGPYHYQRRDAFYATLHRRPRNTTDVPFNRS
jgi:hypothetical protein